LNSGSRIPNPGDHPNGCSGALQLKTIRKFGASLSIMFEGAEDVRSGVKAFAEWLVLDPSR
jgi:hypothetical protein